MQGTAFHNPPALRRALVCLGLLVSLTASPASAQDERPHDHEGHQHRNDQAAGRDDRSHDHDHDARSHHRFDDAERWAAVFDAPERDEWQKPAEVTAFLSVGQGQVVADVGAGTGYFTVHLANAVGSSGRVYAVDIESELIDHIAERVKGEGLEQVSPVLAEPHDPKLPAGEIDLVFICNTWHHIDNRLDYLGRLARVLRPGGRVAIVDFKEGELPVGPPPGEKLSRAAVLEEFEEAGWKLSAESRALPYQFVLVFTP